MTNDDLGRRDRVWHPYTQMLNQPPPLAVVRGEGAFLYTDDGRRVLDGVSSWWVNIAVFSCAIDGVDSMSRCTPFH